MGYCKKDTTPLLNTLIQVEDHWGRNSQIWNEKQTKQPYVEKHMYFIYTVHQGFTAHCRSYSRSCMIHREPLLLAWISKHMPSNVWEVIELSIPKLEWITISTSLYWACDYLSMPGFKLVHSLFVKGAQGNLISSEVWNYTYHQGHIYYDIDYLQIGTHENTANSTQNLFSTKTLQNLVGQKLCFLSRNPEIVHRAEIWMLCSVKFLKESSLNHIVFMPGSTLWCNDEMFKWITLKAPQSINYFTKSKYNKEAS